MSNARVPAAAGGLPTRRATLATVAGLCASLSLPRVARAATSADPIPELYAEAKRQIALANDTRPKSDAELDAFLDAAGACECRAAATTPTTVASALVALNWAIEEVNETRRWGDRADDFIPEMLSQVAAFLRKGGAA